MGSGERDEDDHSKLLLTKNDSPEFSDIKVQTVTLNCKQSISCTQNYSQYKSRRMGSQRVKKPPHPRLLSGYAD